MQSTVPMLRPRKKSAQLKQFLALLRQARTDAGVTQSQLGEAMGVPQSFVSKVEAGERRLDVLELIAWMHALGVSPVTFVATLESKAQRNAPLP